MRREIASVRLLTVHLTGVELVPLGKAHGSCRGGVLDLFNQFFEDVRTSLNSPDRGEADENRAGPAPVIYISGRAVTRREQWRDPDTSGFVSSGMHRVICSMSGGDRVLVHLLLARLSIGSLINRCQRKGEIAWCRRRLRKWRVASLVGCRRLVSVQDG